jgi:uncharacterized membrane protein YfcA
MGLVSAPILLLIDPTYVPGPLLICVLTLVLLMIFREKRAVDFHGLGWGYFGRVIGTVIAVQIFSYLPRSKISLLSAFLILTGVLLSIFKLRARLTIPTLITAGGASGIMSTLSSVGGPPFALLYQYEDGEKLRATMSGFFILGTITSLFGLGIAGEFGISQIMISLPLIPGVFIGYVLSNRAVSFLDIKHTRTAVLLVSTLSSLTVILKVLLNL